MDWISDSYDNVAGYESSAYDTLMSIIARASDGTARMGCLHDAEALLLEDYVLTLYTPMELHGSCGKISPEPVGMPEGGSAFPVLPARRHSCTVRKKQHAQQRAGVIRKLILLFAGTAWLRSCRFLFYQFLHGIKPQGHRRCGYPVCASHCSCQALRCRFL